MAGHKETTASCQVFKKSFTKRHWETIKSVPISQFHPFKDHPFRVSDDVKMQEMVESVKKYGICFSLNGSVK